MNATSKRQLARKLVSAAMLAAGLATASAVVPGSADAAPRDGNCEPGEFCYNYNSDLGGSWSDFTTNVGDYGTKTPSCYVFKGPGNGKGKCIKNEAGGFWNRSDKPVVVYYNSDFNNSTGRAATLAPGSKGRLPNGVYNENASHRFVVTGNPTPPPPPPPVGNTITRDQVIERAKSWLRIPVPYSKTKYRGGWRTDCSGFVSMTWNARDNGGKPKTFTTAMMHQISHRIGKNDLQRGDAINKPGTHVVLFHSWANREKTRYNAYEQTRPHTLHRSIPYPYYNGGKGYFPIRYNNIR